MIVFDLGGVPTSSDFVPWPRGGTAPPHSIIVAIALGAVLPAASVRRTALRPCNELVAIACKLACLPMHELLVALALANEQTACDRDLECIAFFADIPDIVLLSHDRYNPDFCVTDRDSEEVFLLDSSRRFPVAHSGTVLV